MNSLQGLFIFIVVGCQPQVRKAIFGLAIVYVTRLLSRSTGVVGSEAPVDLTIRRSSDDGNDKRPTALDIIARHPLDGREHCQQHNHHVQSRARRDHVLIELGRSERLGCMKTLDDSSPTHR